MKAVSDSHTTQSLAAPSAIATASQQATQRQRRYTLIVIAGRILFFVTLILLWQFISGRIANPMYVSSPQAVLLRMIEWMQDGTLWSNTATTLQETLLGLLYGVTFGILIGVLLGIMPLLAAIFDPFLMAVNSVPKAALAPFFILWFGIELQMKVILGASIVFFLVFFNTLAGMRNVDQNLVNAVLLMGGKRKDIVLKVMLPSATGYILTGLRIAIPYALIGAVIGELISTNSGLGYLINDSTSRFDAAGAFVALIMLTITTSLLNMLFNVIDRKTSRWKGGVTTFKGGGF